MNGEDDGTVDGGDDHLAVHLAVVVELAVGRPVGVAEVRVEGGGHGVGHAVIPSHVADVAVADGGAVLVSEDERAQDDGEEGEEDERAETDVAVAHARLVQEAVRLLARDDAGHGEPPGVQNDVSGGEAAGERDARPSRTREGRADATRGARACVRARTRRSV